MKKRILVGLVALFPFLLTGSTVSAHCDAMDGPVVMAGLKALSSGNVNHSLIWVPATHESEVVDAFEEALELQGRADAERKAAETRFLEVLVRLHRAGEGESFTGLKPTSTEGGPLPKAFDRALEGSESDLCKLFQASHCEAVRSQIAALKAKKAFAPDNLAEGRAFVGAYVSLLHHLLNLHERTERGARTTEAHHH